MLLKTYLPSADAYKLSCFNFFTTQAVLQTFLQQVSLQYSLSTSQNIFRGHMTELLFLEMNAAFLVHDIEPSSPEKDGIK